MNNNKTNYATLMQKLLVSLDVFLLTLALLISDGLHTSSLLEPRNWWMIIAFVVCVQTCFLGLGLYKSKLREKLPGIFRRIILAVSMALLILVLLVKLLGLQQLNADQLFTACLLSGLATFALRYLLTKFNVLGFAKRRVLVLGSGQRAQIIDKRMRRAVDRECFNLVGFVRMDGDLSSEIDSKHLVQLNGSLFDYVISNRIDEVVVATDERRTMLPIRQLFACKLRGVVVSEILDFIEQETGQIAVNLIYPSWIIYSSGFSSGNDLRNSLDRIFNISLALVVLLLTWPFILLTMIAIKIEDGWSAPCFYWQERVGIHGKPFLIVKLRSMRIDAEANGAQWAQSEDDRVTKVGRVIRKYRIDELPQLYNVLIGDMGFVGPRPERPEFVDNLKQQIPYYEERHNVKAGLTGWAQLKYPYGATVADAEEKLKYDLYYIKHRSFLLDLSILIQTAEIVLFGKGR
ncbi:TIGR03013 family PEP-CTERM/XrtA system glycosyltransferase [Thalassotalea ponticola]|uniref:TIGR03013 family XrtA/PEP-CTERM system glycosyltransferase n=1 Tax=Thalassotalea ponticola TaxID=1523392 RepID=UPI0025B529FF|nr:TIGR03013 family XrtA/PEP-CTERM system glycosyltransferase [Thalassotalea ponticola]MDN3652429.1 TIGR03013 family PEP-CTERM/XrtA system glycosyltransferase [Thalassotalea ponticola]